MPFNGSGTFTRLYSWVQDAANGIDILSTRMDNEMNGMATALSDCVTRDGQSPWTANLPAGGFKITGLGTPTSSADSATKGYVDGVVQDEWKAESNSFAWVSGTQFKLTGVDLTAIYHVGRRVKIVHNSGGSTAYATITATAFSTDTTVTIATDNKAALVASITGVSYGLLSYVNPSYLDPRTAIHASGSGPTNYTASAAAKVQFNSVSFDLTSEFSAVNNRFTAIHPGIYLLNGNVTVYTPVAAGAAAVTVETNGGVPSWQSNVVLSATSANNVSIPYAVLANLAAGDYLEVFFSASANQSIGGSLSSLNVVRIA